MEIPSTTTGGTLSGGVGYSVAISATGRLYAIMNETPSGGGLPSVKLRYSDNPTAATPTWGNIALPAIAIGSGVTSPCIVMDTNGDIHLAWFAPATRRIGYAIYRTAISTWTDAQFLYTGSTTLPVKYMQVEVDRSGTVHFLWHEGDPDISGSSADVRYARRPSGGSTFTVRADPLNNTSALNAAFPIAHFGGCDGSVLAVAWREEIGGENWDVKMNVSADNGLTWRASPLIVATGPEKQWDPMIIIDRNQIVHLTYPVKSGIAAVLHYLRFDDVQSLAAQTDSVAQPISDVQLTPDGESHELPYSCYDYDRDIVWLSWKQRRVIEGIGLRDDVLVSYVLRRGEFVSSPERVTDVLVSGENIKFPDFQVAPNGLVFFTYETSVGSQMKLMHRQSRPQPMVPLLEPASAAAGMVAWSFPTEFAVQYQVEESSDLVNWLPQGLAFIGTGSDGEMSLPITTGSHFVRMQINRP